MIASIRRFLSKSNLRPQTRMERREALVGLIFISPWIVGFLLLKLLPIVVSLGFSFTNFDMLHPGDTEFIGLANYAYILEDLFSEEGAAGYYLFNTIGFAILSVPAQLLTALGLAVLLNSLAPLVAFAVWKFSYWGAAFGRVEELFFGRGFLSLGVSYYNWRQAFWSLFGPNPQTAAYYAVEFGAIVLGIVACFATWKRYPGLSAYGLAVVLLSLTSGPAQGMHRYVLAAPSVFLFLSRLGKNPTFDRAWSIISILIMGLLAMMFTYDMWAG
jgi:ABC-type sugar transport system permease subunit